jgi:hypothetical protein
LIFLLETEHHQHLLLIFANISGAVFLLAINFNREDWEGQFIVNKYPFKKDKKEIGNETTPKSCRYKAIFITRSSQVLMTVQQDYIGAPGALKHTHAYIRSKSFVTHILCPSGKGCHVRGEELSIDVRVITILP